MFVTPNYQFTAGITVIKPTVARSSMDKDHIAFYRKSAWRYSSHDKYKFCSMFMRQLHMVIKMHLCVTLIDRQNIDNSRQ